MFNDNLYIFVLESVLNRLILRNCCWGGCDVYVFPIVFLLCLCVCVRVCVCVYVCEGVVLVGYMGLYDGSW